MSTSFFTRGLSAVRSTRATSKNTHSLIKSLLWSLETSAHTARSPSPSLSFHSYCFHRLGSNNSRGSLSLPSLHLNVQHRSFASKRELTSESASEEEEFRDDNGMTLKDREKIENWAKTFTKDSIPKGLLTLNFVRASGPGGQNVNKGKEGDGGFAWKCQICIGSFLDMEKSTHMLMRHYPALFGHSQYQGRYALCGG